MIVKRTLLYLVLVIKNIANSQNSHVQILKVTATAFHPRGFRAEISVDTNVKFLYFYGTLYNNIKNASNFEEPIGKVRGAATKQIKGGWLFEETDVILKVGQVIQYGFVTTQEEPIESSEAGKLYLKFEGVLSEYEVFQVMVLEDPSAIQPTQPSCKKSITKVRGKQVCAGQVIFEDNFDTFREDLWQVEQYIPIDHPEHPFVSYQNLKSDPNVYVDSGHLHIIPKLQEDLLSAKNESIISGSLDLNNGCTRRKCFKVADGADILPPIVSGRLTSYEFAFTYGTIYVRAKIPQGDWLYPEILLEPLFKRHGNESDMKGIFKIVTVGGNREISDINFGNKVIRTHEIDWLTNQMCYDLDSPYIKKKTRGFWGNDFHEYALRWSIDDIVLSVDGIEYAGLLQLIPDVPQYCIKNIFPELFNLNFHGGYHQITLGVAAGGITQFPDRLKTGSGKSKPWRNQSKKACLNFWQDRDSWFPTWTQPGLIVDYVKVVAF